MLKLDDMVLCKYEGKCEKKKQYENVTYCLLVDLKIEGTGWGFDYKKPKLERTKIGWGV
jgi:hypothetical protein